MTFGQLIADARRKADLTQKELAARIRKEDGLTISPQYLNDLERDRRNPPSEFLLKQLARELKLAEDYLLFISGQWPEDLRDSSAPSEQVQAAFQAFRRTLKEGER